MNVANKGIMRKLTLRFLKAAKTRNLIAVAAIALTSLMFTSVFTLGGNMIASIQNETMRQVGTSSHGGLKYLTAEQYENFARSPLIKDISYNILLGMAENDALKKEHCEIRYAEDKMAKWGFSYPSEGRMPQAVNEIACSTIVLDTLGVPREIGAEIPLVFTVGGRTYSETFTLSGFWEGDPVMQAQQIWLSRAYVDSVLAENTIAKGEYAGFFFADLWFPNAFDVQNKMLGLLEERGYAENEINYGVNWAYIGNDFGSDPETAAIGGLILALILLSGYLIIYSIFIISVNADIHFYGLLKTIGATSRQIKKMIHMQALVLSALGVPAGLLLGYAAGVYLTPVLMGIFSVGGASAVSANPLIFIFAAAFSMLTVFVGCRKPGRTAARVSPVEAVKYSGVPAREDKRKTKKTRAVTPFTMAWASVTREKRKLCVIVMSLSLALILLNSAFSATRSFDMDKYLSGSIISDFAVADYSVFDSGTEKNVNGVPPEFLREAAARGAGEINNIYYHYYFYYDGAQYSEAYQIYGVDRATLEYFSDIDYERLSSGNYAVVSEMFFTYGDNPITLPKPGDTVTFTNDNWDGAPGDFEVIGLVREYPQQLSVRVMYSNAPVIILADNVFLDFFGGVAPMQSNINVNAAGIESFEAWIEGYTANIDLSYISRNTLKAEFEGLRTVYLTLGGAMSLILALIGVLNFINAVTASVIARRRELAMLQSVGMTGKQMRKTLFYEGVCYTALTAIFTLTAGLGLGWLILRVIAGMIWFFKQSFTVMPSLYCLIPLFAVCAAVPLVCYKRLTRESLTERLRVE